MFRKILAFLIVFTAVFYTLTHGAFAAAGACGYGQYAVGSSTDRTCVDCEPGYYCPGTDEMVLCPDGYTSDAGAYYESSCYYYKGDHPGQYYDGMGNLLKCAPGTFVSPDSKEKIYFNPDANVETTCDACSSLGDGSYTESMSGASNCYLTTTPGTYVATAGVAPVTCPSGTVFGYSVGVYCPSEDVYYGDTNTPSQCPVPTCDNVHESQSGYGDNAVCSFVQPIYWMTGAGSVAKCRVDVYWTSDWGEYYDSVEYNSDTGDYDANIDFEYWRTPAAGRYLTGKKFVSDRFTYYKENTECVAGSYCPGMTTKAPGNYAAATYGIDACGIGSTSANGASACVVCADGTTTTAAGATSCNATCAGTYDSQGMLAVHSWATPTWNSDNTVTDSCTISKCAGGEFGHFLENGQCLRCDERTGGLFPRISKSGTSSGETACFLYTSDIPGKYVAKENNVQVIKDCEPGKFSAGNSTVVKYKTGTSKCSNCGNNQYSTDAGSTKCESCVTGYQITNGDKTTPESCQLTCPAGYYMPTVNSSECLPVTPGFWSAGGTISQGDTISRAQCPAGETTIGFGLGANEVGDCGRILHLGDNKLYLRSDKKTDLALNVLIGNKTYFGNMSTADKLMSDGIGHSLKLKFNNTEYSVYDDSGENYVAGTPGNSGVFIDQNITPVSTVPATYNDNPSTTWSAELSNGISVYGNARCSTTTATNGDLSEVGFVPNGTGTGCWCQLSSPAPGGSWIYATTNSSCADKCGYFCANNMNGTSTKNITYRKKLYQSAGINVVE